MEDIRQLQKELQEVRSKLIEYPGVHKLIGGYKDKDGKTHPIHSETLLSTIVKTIPDALDKRTRKKANKILEKIEKIRQGPGKAFGDLEYQLDLADPRNETLPAVPYEGQFGTDYRTGEFYKKQGTLPAIRRFNKKKKTKKYFSKNKDYTNKPRKARTRG